MSRAGIKGNTRSDWSRWDCLPGSSRGENPHWLEVGVSSKEFMSAEVGLGRVEVKVEGLESCSGNSSHSSTKGAEDTSQVSGITGFCCIL